MRHQGGLSQEHSRPCHTVENQHTHSLGSLSPGPAGSFVVPSSAGSDHLGPFQGTYILPLAPTHPTDRLTTMLRHLSLKTVTHLVTVFFILLLGYLTRISYRQELHRQA